MLATSLMQCLRWETGAVVVTAEEEKKLRRITKDAGSLASPGHAPQSSWGCVNAPDYPAVVGPHPKTIVEVRCSRYVPGVHPTVALPARALVASASTSMYPPNLHLSDSTPNTMSNFNASLSPLVICAKLHPKPRPTLAEDRLAHVAGIDSLRCGGSFMKQ